MVHTREIMSKEHSDERDTIIFGEPQHWGTQQIRYYSQLSLNSLKALQDKSLLNLSERQNNSPTIEQFVKFMEKYPCVKAHGYVVTRFRADTGVTIEGLITPSESATRELKNAFKTFCKGADELSENYKGNLRSWWD